MMLCSVQLSAELPCPNILSCNLNTHNLHETKPEIFESISHSQSFPFIQLSHRIFDSGFSFLFKSALTCCEPCKFASLIAPWLFSWPFALETQPQTVVRVGEAEDWSETFVNEIVVVVQTEGKSD